MRARHERARTRCPGRNEPSAERSRMRDMSSTGRTLASALLLTLALAPGANAADHLMLVNEVAPSTQDPGLAFVELQDPAGETFPSLAYTLASLDANGQMIGQQTFNPPYGFANTAEPFLVGATGVAPRDATLTISLAAARQVCFYRGAGTSDLIHCLVFDAVPDGRSAQRTSSGGVVQACPTPDAPNRPTAEPCLGAPNPMAPLVDATPPELALAGKRRQRVGRLLVGAVVNEQATLRTSGFIRVAGRNRPFVRMVAPAEPGATTRFRIKLTAAGLKAARRALDQGNKLTAKVRVTARDAAGNVSVKKRSIDVRS